MATGRLLSQALLALAERGPAQGGLRDDRALHASQEARDYGNLITLFESVRIKLLQERVDAKVDFDTFYAFYKENRAYFEKYLEQANSGEDLTLDQAVAVIQKYKEYEDVFRYKEKTAAGKDKKPSSVDEFLKETPKFGKEGGTAQVGSQFVPQGKLHTVPETEETDWLFARDQQVTFGLTWFGSDWRNTWYNLKPSHCSWRWRVSDYQGREMESQSWTILANPSQIKIDFRNLNWVISAQWAEAERLAGRPSNYTVQVGATAPEFRLPNNRWPAEGKEQEGLHTFRIRSDKDVAKEVLDRSFVSRGKDDADPNHIFERGPDGKLELKDAGALPARVGTDKGQIATVEAKIVGLHAANGRDKDGKPIAGAAKTLGDEEYGKQIAFWRGELAKLEGQSQVLKIERIVEALEQAKKDKTISESEYGAGITYWKGVLAKYQEEERWVTTVGPGGKITEKPSYVIKAAYASRDKANAGSLQRLTFVLTQTEKTSDASGSRVTLRLTDFSNNTPKLFSYEASGAGDTIEKAELAALAAVRTKFHEDNPYQLGHVQMAVVLREGANAGVVDEASVDTGTFRKEFHRGLKDLKEVADTAALVIAAAALFVPGLQAFALPMITIAAAAFTVTDVALSMYDRAQRGDLHWDKETWQNLVELAGAIVSIFGLPAVTKAIGKPWVAGMALIATTGLHGAAGVLIAVHTVSAIDGVRGQYAGRIAMAKTAEERRKIKNERDTVIAQILADAAKQGLMYGFQTAMVAVPIVKAAGKWTKLGTFEVNETVHKALQEGNVDALRQLQHDPKLTLTDRLVLADALAAERVFGKNGITPDHVRTRVEVKIAALEGAGGSGAKGTPLPKDGPASKATELPHAKMTEVELQAAVSADAQLRASHPKQFADEGFVAYYKAWMEFFITEGRSGKKPDKPPPGTEAIFETVLPGYVEGAYRAIAGMAPKPGGETPAPGKARETKLPTGPRKDTTPPPEIDTKGLSPAKRATIERVGEEVSGKAPKAFADPRKALEKILTATDETPFDSAYGPRGELVKEMGLQAFHEGASGKAVERLMGGKKGERPSPDAIAERLKTATQGEVDAFLADMPGLRARVEARLAAGGKPGKVAPGDIKATDLESHTQGLGFSVFIEDTLRALFKDGIRYTEQSFSVQKLLGAVPESEIQRIVAKLKAGGIDIKLEFLPLVTTSHLSDTFMMAGRGDKATINPGYIKSDKNPVGVVTEAQAEALIQHFVAKLRAEAEASKAPVDPAKLREAAVQKVMGSSEAEIAGILGPDGKPVVSKEAAHTLTSKLPPDIAAGLEAVIARGDVIGFDIAAPEKFGFSDRGLKNFEHMYEILKAAAKKRGKPVVLRPHVGEGYITGQEKFSTTTGIPADKGTPAHYKTARENLDALLATLSRMGYGPAKAAEDGVVIRFGHATHTTPEQAKMMAQMGIIAEVNLGSNAVTGAVIPTQGREVSADGKTVSVPGRPDIKPVDRPTALDDHAFLHMLYHQTEIVLNTDAHGVMHTTLAQEYATAERIITMFKKGMITITVDGKPTRYSELPKEVQARFTMERIKAAAERYRKGIKEGRVGGGPPGSPAPPPAAADER